VRLITLIKILIFGITGQDGSLLARKILHSKKKYKVYGVSRKKNYKNLKKLKIYNKINFKHFDIISKSKVEKTIKSIKPNYIYNFSGITTIGESYKDPYYTYQSICLGNLNILNTLINFKKKSIKYFFASSAECFGNNLKGEVSELTQMDPHNPYSLAKFNSMEMNKMYRKIFNVKCSNGILFNHESHLRDDRYFTIKFIEQALKLKEKKINEIVINNSKGFRNWGSANEYVDAIKLINESKFSDDFIIANDQTHSVNDFINTVKKILKLKKLKIKETIPVDANSQKGYGSKKFKVNNNKIKKVLKWYPKKNLKDIITDILLNKFNYKNN
jgi:GDPmannose 4,6-dehydratase